MVKPGQIDVIKQGKRPPEEFSPDKLHNSIIATCLSVRTPEGQAQDIAKTVTLGVMNRSEERRVGKEWRYRGSEEG